MGASLLPYKKLLYEENLYCIAAKGGIEPPGCHGYSPVVSECEPSRDLHYHAFFADVAPDASGALAFSKDEKPCTTGGSHERPAQ